MEAPQRWLPVHVSSCCHCSWTFAEVRGMRDSTEAACAAIGTPNEKGCARCRQSYRASGGHQREVLVRSCRLQAMVAARGFQLGNAPLSVGQCCEARSPSHSSGRGYSRCPRGSARRSRAWQRQKRAASAAKEEGASGVGVSVGVAVSASAQVLSNIQVVSSKRRGLLKGLLSPPHSQPRTELHRP